MKNLLYCIVVLMFMGAVSCSNKSEDETGNEVPVVEETPDSMVYGLTCDGTNDSVVVLYLFSGEDPIVYDIQVAKAQGRIIGQPKIGDWIGVLPNPADTTEALMVVDLDQLKGTWTYSVKPVWKDSTKMSRKALRRKMAEVPDSLREAYMVPREYGFTLKRSSKATPVGYVMRSSSLEDDSPVEYPEVKNYTGWKCRNGRLVLTRVIGGLSFASNDADKQEVKDTFDMLLLTDDSLVLADKTGAVVHFHRQVDAFKANEKASKAAQKASDAKQDAMNKKENEQTK